MDRATSTGRAQVLGSAKAHWLELLDGCRSHESLLQTGPLLHSRLSRIADRSRQSVSDPSHCPAGTDCHSACQSGPSISQACRRGSSAQTPALRPGDGETRTRAADTVICGRSIPVVAGGSGRGWPAQVLNASFSRNAHAQAPAWPEKQAFWRHEPGLLPFETADFGQNPTGPTGGLYRRRSPVEAISAWSRRGSSGCLLLWRLARPCGQRRQLWHPCAWRSPVGSRRGG